MWYSRYQFKHISTPYMEKKGLTSPRFDNLLSCIKFSRQQHPRMEGMDMKEWEWQLVNNHIKNFNTHRLESLYPSESLCVEIVFSIWNGSGGDWIKLGLPHYGQMYWKPYAGCGIQDTCCGRSMVMLKLKLVKGRTEDEASADSNVSAPAENDNYGTTVIK